MLSPLIPLYLAPMAGFTNSPMRVISERFGAAKTSTEMVSAHGLLYENGKTKALLECLPEEKNCVAHIYGSDPEILGRAAAYITELNRFCGIDLNAGCPVPHVTKCGAGSALIQDVPRIGRILKAIVANTTLPVSIKTRLGPHPEKTAVFDILKTAEDAGATEFILHARFTSQGHSGNIHPEILREVVAQAGIPVVGNGAVRTPAEIEAMAALGVKAVMIARGALGNPWLFSRSKPSLEEIRQVLCEHLELEKEYRRQLLADGQIPDDSRSPEDGAVTAFRHNFFRYLAGIRGSNYLRTHLNDYTSLDDVMCAVDACLKQEADYRAAAPE